MELYGIKSFHTFLSVMSRTKESMFILNSKMRFFWSLKTWSDTQNRASMTWKWQITVQEQNVFLYERFIYRFFRTMKWNAMLSAKSLTFPALQKIFTDAVYSELQLLFLKLSRWTSQFDSLWVMLLLCTG